MKAPTRPPRRYGPWIYSSKNKHSCGLPGVWGGCHPVTGAPGPRAPSPAGSPRRQRRLLRPT